jgi:hypothetical protein
VARLHPTHHPIEVAVGDVVQRCIDAGADQVDVAIEFAGARSWIRIAAVAATDVPSVAGDPELAGAPTMPATPEGLDVIAAGLALGSAVTVAVQNASGERWLTRWEREGSAAPAHLVPAVDVTSLPDPMLRDPAGTVVLVEGLNEVLAYKRQEGRVIEAVVARMCSRVVDALGLAFHRALAGAQRRRTLVAITVNAEPVAARDPFALPGPSLHLRQRELPFVVGERVEAVAATPHVLSRDGADPVAGRQGFFVYLRDRLVQAGGWSRLSVSDRADGLARIAVDLPASAVASFTWEVAARRVLFPITLAPALRALAFEAVTAPLGRAAALPGL